MIQVNKFEGGGFVIHKIVGNYKGRMSAWFDENGKLVDAEQIIPTPLGVKAQPVKKGGPMWKLAQEIGLFYGNTVGQLKPASN